MEKIDEIIKMYKPYYNGQEKYYHNFDHAVWVVKKGIEILNFLDVKNDDMHEIYAYAMACHDAHHLNGLQNNDRQNVDRALVIFKNKSNFLTLGEKKAARSIIDATCMPYDDISIVLKRYNWARNNDIYQLIEVARDADHLGIIGITNVQEREIALTGLIREFAQKMSIKIMLENYKKSTIDFFDSISFYTEYANDWSADNLENMKQWQLSYSETAIKKAYKI